MESRELAPGIVWIGDRSGGRVRAFLVAGADGLTLVDTLASPHPHAILAAIRRLGRSPGDLKHILLTHAHYSHLRGLAALKQLTGATVWSHAWEADVVAGNRPAQAVPLLPKRPLRTYVPFQLGLALGRGRHTPCEVDRALEDEAEAGGLVVLHAPGHTPGHTAFWSEEHRVLLSGDAVVTWPEVAAGWESFTLNPAQHRESVRRLAGLEPRAVGVGHGDPIARGAADVLKSL